MKIEYRTILLYALAAAPVLLILCQPQIATTLLLLCLGGVIGYLWGYVVGLREGEKTSLFLQFEENLSNAGMLIIPEEEALGTDDL